MQRGHAIANGVFVAAVNRVGREGERARSGASRSSPTRSAACWRAPRPSGRRRCVVECDLAAIEQARRNWPFLRDRRIDAYADLTRRSRRR